MTFKEFMKQKHNDIEREAMELERQREIVEDNTWEDCTEACSKLSKQEVLDDIRQSIVEDSTISTWRDITQFAFDILCDLVDDERIDSEVAREIWLVIAQDALKRESIK